MTPDPVRSIGTPSVPRNAVWELELPASWQPADPWAEIELDVQFTDPDGTVRAVPAFWSGGRAWRVRYSADVEGVHRWRTVVRAARETGLEDRAGELTVLGYHGANPLLLHGGPTVAPDGRHLAHADGTPFLWLADAWWSAMTARFRWPDTFQTLADDRAAKGFTVVQLVAGLVPEFGLFSPQMASEGGQPWQDKGRGPINPAYYDVPDLKLDYLVGKGIVPAIVGAWGSWAQVLDRAQVMAHWRYVVARYGAYPVIWSIAGEAEMPYLFAPIDGELADERVLENVTEYPEAPRQAQAELWESASRLVGEIDPFQRIRTVEPCPGLSWSSSRVFRSRDAFELDALQTGHEGVKSVVDTMTHLHASLAHGDKPVLVAECSFEGIFDAVWHDVVRFNFWSQLLSGAAGFSYGTMPISTFSSREDPYMAPSRVSSYHWEDAIGWLGAAHAGVGRAILERLRWWELRPAPQAIEPHAGPDDWFLPFAAALPDGSRVVYLPSQALMSAGWGPEAVRATLVGLDAGRPYRATFVDPRTGREQEPVAFVAEGGARELRGLVPAVPQMERPTWEDWVLIVRPADGALGSRSDPPWQQSAAQREGAR